MRCDPMNWEIGEEVVIWSVRSQQMYKGVVAEVKDTLKILIHASGKVYNYNLDGSAILPEGRTNQRVFPTRLMNEVLIDDVPDFGSWGPSFQVV